ncbi:MAG: hypothetical protein ACKVHR_20070 [Pirellulales bacterium]
MDTIQAVLIVAGESPCVLELADGKLDGHVKQRNPIGSISATGEPSTKNVIFIELPLNAENDRTALFDAEKWLTRNRTELDNCDAQKTLEFYTFLGSNAGSRILTIPNSLVRICGELDLDVANQAIRIMTETEYNELRSSDG